MGGKRWVYLGMLAVTGIAFMADKLFFRSAQEASAQSESVRAKSAPKRQMKRSRSGERPSTTEKTNRPGDLSMTWLEQMTDSPSRRNLFAPSVDMLTYCQQLEAEDAEKKAEEAALDPDSPEMFIVNHELQATFNSDSVPLAVVNYRTLGLGDRISGYRLTKIEPNRIKFRRGKDRVTLTIPPPSLESSSYRPVAPTRAEPQKDEETKETLPAASPPDLSPLVEQLLKFISG